MISVLSDKWTRHVQGRLWCSACSWGESGPTSLQSSTIIGASRRGYHPRHLVGLRYKLARAPPLPGIICNINSNLGRRERSPAPAGSFPVPWGGSGPKGSPIGAGFGLHSRRGDSPRRERAKVLATTPARTRQSAAAAFSRLYTAAEPPPRRRRVPKDLASSQWSTTVAPLVTTPRAALICARLLSNPPLQAQ